MKPTVWSAPALLMCVCLCTFAQSTKGDVLVGVSLSGTKYVGDINAAGGDASVPLSPGFDVYVRKATPSRVQTEFRCGYLSIVANNPTLAPAKYTGMGETDTLIQPNTYTETPVIYANLNARLNFRTRGVVFPYATAGLMGASYYPRFSDGILLSRKTSFRAPTDRKYGAYTVMLPLSLGTDIQVNPNLLIGLGYTYTLSGTDYLDNIAVLGTRQGNDQLHTLRMGAAFSFLHKELPANAPSEKPGLNEDEQLVAEALGNSYEPLPATIPGEMYFVRLKSIARNINPVFVMQDTTRLAAPAPTCDCDSLTRQFEKRIAELRQERDILRVQYNDLLDDVSAMTLLSDSIRNQLYLKESVIVELAGKTPSRSRGTIDSLMAEMGKLRFRLSESEMMRNRLRLRTDSLQTEADLQASIAAALEKQVTGLQTTTSADETLQATLAEYKKELTQVQRENKRMRQQLESGTSPYKQINELQATLENLQREYNLVQARLKTMEPLAKRADSLQRVVDQLRTLPVSVAPSASGDIDTQLALARAESEQLAMELERALDARREMDQSVGKLQEELAQMRHENTQMQTLVDGYAARPAPAPVATRSANLEALEEENIRLRRESAILNEQLRLASENSATQTAKLERDIQLGQTERKGLTQAYEQRIAELQADLNRAITTGGSAGSQAMYAENQRLKEEIAQTRADIARLEAVAQEASSGINAELERVTAENDRLSGDIRARETEYAQLYTQFEEIRNTLSALGGEDLKRKNTDLTEQVQRLQDRLATIEAGGNSGPTTTQYEQQILSLKQQLNHLQSVLKNPYNRLDQALVAANEQLERTVAQKENELNELRKQTDPQLIARLKEEVEATHKALDEALGARAQAEAALADGRIAVKQAEGRMGVLEQQLSEARAIAAKAQEGRIQHKTQLETALATEKTAKSHLEADVRRLQRDLDTLHAQYTALANNGQTTVDQQIAILTAEKNRLGEQVFALNKRQSEMQSEVARLQADAEEANALRQQLDEVRRSTLSNDQKVIQEQLVKTREAYGRLQEEYETLQAQAATNDPALLRNQIDRLQKQLTEDREQVALLYAENNELRRKVNLSNLPPSAEEQVLQLRNDNDVLTKRITEEQARNKKLYEEMVAMQRAQGNIAVLQQIEEAQKQTKLAQQKIAEAERQRADALGKMRIQGVEMETLRTRLAIAEREAQNYKKQLESAQIAASTQPDANPAATAALQQARDEAERQRKQALEAADKAEMATQEAQMAYEKATLLLKKANTEIASLNTDVARLSAEVARLNGKPQTIASGTPQPQGAGADPAMLQELRSQLTEAQARLTQSQAEITKMGRDLEGERANGKRLFEENQLMLRERNTFAALQTELASTKTQVEDLTRRNTDMRAQLDALAQQKRALEQELAARTSSGDPCESLKADLQELQRRYADLLNRTRDNDTELALAQAQRSDFANRLADANRQLNSLEAEVAGLRARTPGAAPASGSGDVAQLLQLKQQQVDQLDARVQSREAEVRELKTRLQQASAGQQDIQSITNELAEARKKILLMEQQLKNQPGGATSQPVAATNQVPGIPATSGLNTNLTPANDPTPDVQAQADQIMPHAFVVPSAAEKTVVRDRIVRYFASLGATYQMVDGKLFYDNVLIPEISDQPLDITFYMLRDGRGNKQLLGSFTNQDGAYLEKQKFPLETYYARLLLTQLAQ